MAADAARLLGQVADALNQCERAGLTVQLNHGGALTAHGYVLAVGDGRLGHRWQARTRLPAPDDPAVPDSGGS